MTAPLQRLLYIEREGRPARMIVRNVGGEVSLLQENRPGVFELRHGPVEIRKEIADAERLASVYDQFRGAMRKEMSLSLALIALIKDPTLAAATGTGTLPAAAVRPAAADDPHRVHVTPPPVSSQPAARDCPECGA